MATTVQPITPRAFDTVGGFLGRRFHANREARLKDPLLSEEFIRLHERKAHTIFHWTKTYDDWSWLGEQVMPALWSGGSGRCTSGMSGWTPTLNRCTRVLTRR